VVGGNRFGRLQSYDLLKYAFGERQRLPQDVIQAIVEWENVLGEILEVQTANRRRDILVRAERHSLHLHFALRQIANHMSPVQRLLRATPIIYDDKIV
jgi:hypothetical protein